MPVPTSLLVLVTAACLGIVAGFPEVTTPSGTVRGIVQKTTFGKEFNAFVGIPYAKPPIGKHRFKQSVPSDPWKGVWNATAIPNSCLHVDYFGGGIVGSEDCLYVNVYTPKEPSSKPRDVLVYIHGGGFQFLSGAAYGPEYILEKDLIYVTFNYRLGVLGFFSLEDDLVPGNNGLKDQNLALKWVNRNIAAFGGDPKKITLSGMSAGGASVHYHILSKQSRGLFQRAIINSGAVSNPWATTENVREKSLKVTAELGCPTDSSETILVCLRERPAERIVKGAELLRAYGYFPLATIGPMIEKPNPSAFIDKHPNDIMRDGEANDVPILWTYNSDEGLFPGAELLADTTGQIDKNWDRLIPLILELNDTVSPKQQVQIAHQIREHYLGGKSIREVPGKFVEMFGDRLFYLGIHEAAKLHAEFSTSPSWLYQFSYVGSNRLSDNYKINDLYKGGACHGDDTHFVLRAVYCPLEGNPNDETMIKLMTDIWVNFMQGNMPSSWKTLKSGLPNLTLLDIVCTDPKNNVIKTKKSTPGQELWMSFRIPENSIDLIQSGHQHNEL